MSDVPWKSLKNGFAIPVLGQGTWRMGGVDTPDTANDDADIAAIRRGIATGLCHIDTAEMYAGGHAEELVGIAMKGQGIRRADYFLTDKVWKTHLRYDDVLRAAEASLKRLGTDYIDLYLIHQVNPDVPEEQQDPTTYQGPSFLWFPAGEAGYKAWEKWENSAYLQQFPGHMDENQLREEVSREGCRRERKIFFSLQQENGPTYLLTIRSESHPWKAAVDQLKYVYFISFLFVAGCGIFTLRVLEKTYSQRARMEEQRKDFMNVMAHEIKTPLGVIRGFSENLRENPHSEKRDYYLSQMIRQTEEIDTLVKDMITVTRMDWEQLEIKKTPVSLGEVLNRERKRLADGLLRRGFSWGDIRPALERLGGDEEE